MDDLSQPSAELDGGDRGCADGLTKEFNAAMDALEPGQVLRVSMRDPSAKADLPSMARMRGHEVIETHDTAEATIIFFKKGL